MPATPASNTKNTKTQSPDRGRNTNTNTKPDQNDSTLDRIARTIDPSSHEVSDDDPRDPGRMTPDSPPTDNRS